MVAAFNTVGTMTKNRAVERWAARLALMLAMFLSATPGSVSATSKPGEYGKVLVQTIELPPEVLAKFARHQEKKGSQLATSVLNANTEDWHGSEMSLSTEAHPYTLVIRVGGTAVDDGDALSQWTSGWALDGMEPISLMAPLGKKGAKAGERIESVGAGKPIRFKEDRKGAPSLSFVAATNIRIDSVKMEVWSGVADAGGLGHLFAWSPLLVGVVFLGLVLWFRRS